MESKMLKQTLHQFVETADEQLLNTMLLMLKDSIDENDDEDVDDDEAIED